ncbi:MAG: FtsW/RodA/SpoVE family cell cycle protein [Erysipelotrichaceae bacterium]|nr:FtsW/RodA/SpoVE family cell cycle protein [Erysipelotrichaceae bacterium]
MIKRIRKMFSIDDTDKLLYIATLCLVVFGSIMIFSAEMGNALSLNNTNNPNYFPIVIAKQLLFVFIGLVAMLFVSNVNIMRKEQFYYTMAAVIGAVLLSCRLFGSVHGAYAWIRTPIGTIQPSEFAKIFTIVMIGRFAAFHKETKHESIDLLRNMLYVLASFAVIIVVLQKDTGSGLVLAGIAYLLLLMLDNKYYFKFRKVLFIGLFVIIAGVIFVVSPVCTAFLESLGSSSYMVGRFLASANPFKYQYNIGYHLVMSLVSFATGGVFGLGYGNSIHKYMNFPNPENDFILPVIVEELGIIGFSIIVILYGIIIFTLYRYAFSKKADLTSKIILLGVSLYFILHFILNVGGVTGFIPLTGVPLLLISSGGSSWIASLMAIGFAQNEIKKIKRKMIYENNSR